MEILGSNQFVDLKIQKEPWYQLDVVNQWDWNTKAIGFKQYDNITIAYCLKLYSPKTETTYTGEVVEDITDEMKEVLVGMGLHI